MTTRETRIIKLEAAIQARKGCPTCRRWDGTVITDSRGAQSRPEACPQCGRTVPFRQRVHIERVSLEDI